MLLTGYAGQTSLGHAGLIAAGAFTTGILAHEAHAPFWVTLPASALSGMMLGFIFGLPSLRLRGLYLAVSTLALHFIVIYLGGEYESKRGFSTGIVVDPPSLFGIKLTHGRAWVLRPAGGRRTQPADLPQLVAQPFRPRLARPARTRNGRRSARHRHCAQPRAQAGGSIEPD